MTPTERDECRRKYVEAEIAQAGLTGEQAVLAMASAMSASDTPDDDDFELMVAACIEGAADSTSATDILIDISKL